MSDSASRALDDYQRMCLIRQFELALDELFAQGLITGTSHFCTGQEACAVGAIAALRPDDLVTSNHRGHGHFLAKGADPGRVMAELLGKATGYSSGRGGSQHMADFSIGFLGSNGITGGMTPIATGAALSQKLLNTSRVVVCFFGDGASGQGACAEALNMAAVWDLPIVYVCENNQYAMSTPVPQAFGEPSVAARFAGYGIPTCRIDGNDYFAVRQAARQGADRARSDGGPTLIEALTYRMCGHSKSDKCEYRPAEEEQHWAQRDPLQVLADRLVRDGLASKADLDERQERVSTRVRHAIEFAQSSPAPDPETVRDDLYVSF